MSTATSLASKAEDALERRDNYPASAESEATAGVGFALLAILAHLMEGTVGVIDCGRS